MKVRLNIASIAFALLAAACSGSGETATSMSAPGTTEALRATTSTTSTTSAPATTTNPAPAEVTTTSTTAAAELPPEVAPTDWLTVANGLVLSSFEGDEDAVSASTALRAVDGAPNQIGFANDLSSPSVYTFELPAETTFDRFAVPDTRDSPGNTTFFGSIEIVGSNTSANEDFEVLVSADFEELAADEELAEFTPASRIPVRWLRLTLSGALQVEEEHEPGRTVVRFTELIGNGTQQVVPMSEAFTGVWQLKFTDNPGGNGDLAELKQSGAVVSGCIGFAEVEGTVTGNVLRLNGTDTRDGRPSVYLLSTSSDGELRGVESTNNGVFRSRFGPLAPAGTTTPCSDAALAPLACGSKVYINFDVNSAVIRTDSEPVLDDLLLSLESIESATVTIVGHTSTEGSTEYNQELSERRAQAVLDALVARGLDAEGFSASGLGESEPLVSESDEASRAINRRVEIACG